MYSKLFLKSAALAATHRFDAIFAGRVLPEGLIAWAIARLSGRPVLVYAHGEELTGWGRGRKFRLSCFVLATRRCPAVQQRFHPRHAGRSHGCRPGSHRAGVPHGRRSRVSAGPRRRRPARCRSASQAGQKLILSVGRLMRRKGFDNVIRALPCLQQQGVDTHYAIIGIGEDQEYLRALAAELGVTERVHLLGHVSYEDLPRWYCASDLFAMPNRDIGGDTEGFGLVYLEAAAAGRPSLAGLAGGTGSAVEDGVTGLRVDGERVDAVAQGLARLLTNRVEAEPDGPQRARTRARKLHAPAPGRPVARVGAARPLPRNGGAESPFQPIADGVKRREFESVRSRSKCVASWTSLTLYPTPAARPASMSESLSPTSKDCGRSSARSALARRIIPGFGLRSLDSRRNSPTPAVGW